LEQKVARTYENIPQAAQREDITIAEKIDQIAQAIDQYHKETKNIREQLTLTTPPAVKEQRKKEATMQI
jgi:hypothetical protein